MAGAIRPSVFANTEKRVSGFMFHKAEKRFLGLQIYTNTELKKSFLRNNYQRTFYKHYYDVPKAPLLGSFDHLVEFSSEIILGNLKMVGKSALGAIKKGVNSIHRKKDSPPSVPSNYFYR